MAKQSIDDYLREQSDLSAVEKFAFQHDFHQLPEEKKVYEELIPKTSPGPGEQYAFAVDLDQCTGCKACVTACHNENGLEEDETWRAVGLIHGGTTSGPVTQHITGACHHCLDPACMNGCPVNAYEKDSVTGIVKHLDDQCIGCQYCTFKCPYEVPKYNKKKGIVHKCDMCIGRLNVGEAPACVRACPNGAIRIELVETAAVRRDPNEFLNVPEAPDSNYTLPTTRYKTARNFPADMISTDFFAIKPEHAHMPLVVMLVLTQLSVGAFVLEWLLKAVLNTQANEMLTSYRVLVALGVGLLALGASTLHLGRPLYAFRAVVGLKKSWLSREIVVFGAFAGMASVCALNYWSKDAFIFPLSVDARAVVDSLLIQATAVAGLLGVYCSVMVYRDTRRAFWDNAITTLKFFLTTGILGAAAILLTSFIFASLLPQEAGTALMQSFGGTLCVALWNMSAFKLLVEANIFSHLRSSELTSLKRTALLLTGPLKNFMVRRFVVGIFGGIVLPFVFLNFYRHWGQPMMVTVSAAIFVFCFAGELLERYLFFRAVVPLRMPGGKA